MSNKTFLIASVVAFLILLAVVNWNTVKASVQNLVPGSLGGQATPPSSGSTTSTGKATTATGSGINYNRVLAKGVSGPEVKMLQETLNKINRVQQGIALQLAEDGKFGPLTEKMLQYYAGVTSITLNQAIAIYQKRVGA